MFGQVSHTPYDIEFSLFGIPVRIHPLFWLIGIILGWGLRQADLITIWVLCLFISILVHEMGHAIMIRAFGFSPHIVLHHFGGYASYIPGPKLTYWKSIAISFAGPLAGFMLFGLVMLIQIVVLFTETPLSDPLWFAFNCLIGINLYWGLINLLPVFPLDGGQICRDSLALFRVRDYFGWTCRIGFVTGLLVAVFFLQSQNMYAAVMFGMLAALNLKTLSDRDAGY